MSLALVDAGNGSASPVDSPDEYLRDVHAVGSHPGHFLRTFVEQSPHYSVATRTHPPGPVLLLWTLGKVGIHRPEVIGLMLTVLACSYVSLLSVAVRSLCHESARRLMPILVLAPYAVWIAVSMDGIVLMLATLFVALGVTGSAPGRSPLWALASGLVLGGDALLNYAVAWLGVSVVAVCSYAAAPPQPLHRGWRADPPWPGETGRLQLDGRAFLRAGRLLGTRRTSPRLAALGFP